MEYLDIILSIVAGLAAAIPLVVKLIQYVKTSVKEKNWTKVLELLMQLMAEAEQLFAHGADRKEWVMAMLRNAAAGINYDVDMAVISKLIDELCAMSKQVNVDGGSADEKVGGSL